MTVGELIKLLEKYPKELKVMRADSEYEEIEIDPKIENEKYDLTTSRYIKVPSYVVL